LDPGPVAGSDAGRVGGSHPGARDHAGTDGRGLQPLAVERLRAGARRVSAHGAHLPARRGHDGPPPPLRPGTPPVDRHAGPGAPPAFALPSSFRLPSSNGVTGGLPPGPATTWIRPDATSESRPIDSRCERAIVPVLASRPVERSTP